MSLLSVVSKDAKPINSNLFNLTLKVEYKELILIVLDYCCGFASVPKYM